MTTAAGTSVELSWACFTPTVLRVQAGETVTWVNRDGMAHTVTGVNGSWGDYTELNEGDSVSHVFATAGAYPYFCLLHPGMVGTIEVGDGTGSSEAVSLAAQGPEQAASPAATGDGSGGTALWLYAGISVAAMFVAGAGGFAMGRRRG